MTNDQAQTIQALRASLSERDVHINQLQAEIHNLNLGRRELTKQNEALRAELRAAQTLAGRLGTELAELRRAKV